MRVYVDRDRCEGHGVCEVSAPEVFSLDDDGAVVVLRDPLPAELEALSQGAARACPTAALRIG